MLRDFLDARALRVSIFLRVNLEAAFLICDSYYTFSWSRVIEMCSSLGGTNTLFFANTESRSFTYGAIDEFLFVKENLSKSTSMTKLFLFLLLMLSPPPMKLSACLLDIRALSLAKD